MSETNPAAETPRGPVSLAESELSAALPDGVRLCLFGAEVFLFDTDTAQPLMQVSPDAHVLLESGRLWSKLELGDRRHTLTPRGAAQCLEVIGLGRLRQRAQNLSAPLFSGRLSELERAALAAHVGADELLLLAAPSRVRLRGVSLVTGVFRRPAQFVVTDQRCFLLAVSAAGDIVTREFIAPCAFAGGQLVAASGTVKVPRALHRFMTELALDPVERSLELARRAFCSAERVSYRAAVSHVLTVLAARGVLRARWLLWLLALEVNAAPFPAVLMPAELRLADPGVDIAALWDSWGLSEAIVDAALRDFPAGAAWDRAACDWAERIWRKTALDTSGQSFDRDLVFASRLLSRGARQRAHGLLREVRHKLPDITVFDAVLPGLTAPVDKLARQRLETLLKDSSDDDAERLTASEQLLRLAPLAPPNLAAVAALDTARRGRVEEVLSLLQQPLRGEPEEGVRGLRPLPADVIERRLHRGLLADEASWALRMKTWIAKESRPESSTLRHYCERVTRADAAILRVVDDAASLLGVGQVDVYVSRGEDDVGIRVFDDKRPFLLVGGQHLEAGSAFWMSSRELYFAVAAELLHLRADNVRVSGGDVWRGALHTGRQGLDVAFAALPLLRSLKFLDRVGLLTAKLSLPQVGRALDATRRVRRVIASDEAVTGEAHGLSAAAEKLIERQREMQLYADRVGLLAAGSLAAAARAMLIVRHDTARAARDLNNSGVLEVVERHRSGEPAVFHYFLERLANLVLFSLDPDFPALLALAQRSAG